KFADYRILKPSAVVNIGTAICNEAATDSPLNAWFAIGEDDNGEHSAIDLAPAHHGRCYDVFHETYWDPNSATIVADSLAQFLERLLQRGKAYWFDKGFKREYFSE